MATLLIRNARRIETFDDSDTAYDGGSIFVRDNVIEAIGSSAGLPQTADRIVDASNCIVIPGLVNTHHHFYQTLTRNVPGTQDAKLFDWLVTLYPIWARMDAEAFRTATGVALAELLKSGCTTAFDHTYMWPNGARVDDQIEVAREMGVRFHVSRGSMSVGRSKGGLPPDSCVENEDAILADCERVIDAYPVAVWRAGAEVYEDEDATVDTEFEKAWKSLESRLGVWSRLQRAHILALLSTYSVLLIGAKGTGDLSTELPRGSSPDQVLYLKPYSGGGGPATGNLQDQRARAMDATCSIREFDIDPNSPRYGERVDAAGQRHPLVAHHPRRRRAARRRRLRHAGARGRLEPVRRPLQGDRRRQRGVLAAREERHARRLR